MKIKLFTILLLSVVFTTICTAQCPTTNIELISQDDIDNFRSTHCYI